MLFRSGCRQGGAGKGVQARGCRQGGACKGVQARGCRQGGAGKGVQAFSVAPEYDPVGKAYEIFDA